jgi:hypothetical protein
VAFSRPPPQTNSMMPTPRPTKRRSNCNLCLFLSVLPSLCRLLLPACLPACLPCWTVRSLLPHVFWFQNRFRCFEVARVANACGATANANAE